MNSKVSRNVAKVVTVDRRLLTISLAVLANLLILVFATFAKADGHVTKSHGYSYFGGMKYSVDFKHLDYVNPNAPRGGEISTWAFGTFDSMNPYSRKGRAAALASVPFESLMSGTADEVGSLYGLLASESEYPDEEEVLVSANAGFLVEKVDLQKRRVRLLLVDNEHCPWWDH